MGEKIEKSNAEWATELTPDEYRILREKGTERAFTGKFWNSKDKGTYVCAGCGNRLFASDTKFDSGTGWPSTWLNLSLPFSLPILSRRRSGRNVILDLSGNQFGVYMRYLICSLRLPSPAYTNNDHSRRLAGQPFSIR